MAEITAERMGELVRGVFGLLMREKQGLQAKDVLARLEGTVPPTPFECTTYPKSPAVRRYEKIVRFATIGPVKAGWMVKEKGVWSLTEAGRAAYKNLKDPEEFFREARRLYQQWKKDQPDKDDEDDTDEIDEDVVAYEEIEETAWSQVKARLSTTDPYDVQRLVAGLLQGMGYHIAWEAPPGPDKGIDIIAHTDPLGASGPRLKVQVKREDRRVAVQPIRAFLSTLEDDDVGLFMNTGGFTSAAAETARHSRKRLMLLDAAQLFELWVQYYDRIPDLSRRLLPLSRPIYFPLPPA